MKKIHRISIKAIAASIVILSATAAMGGVEKKKEAPAPVKVEPKKVREISLSVFVIPRTPAEGRDPFFPRKTPAAAARNA